MPIEIHALKAKKHYWARKNGEDDVEVVCISTIFGEQPEFHTAAIIGSDQHFDLAEFEYLAEISVPLVVHRNEGFAQSG